MNPGPVCIDTHVVKLFFPASFSDLLPNVLLFFDHVE